MADVTVVFDFDKTIIDCDSDNWVIDELGGTQIFDELLKTMPWNAAMDTIMRELHSKGRTIEDIKESLRKAPLPANTISAIKSAYALGCELRIVSDANRLFIETILEHHGLINYFSEINTNPSSVEEGRLRIFPYHDFYTSSHGCSLCPPNMCKGIIVERIQYWALAKGKRIIYLGDGKGDYCPSLKLKEEDCVMPRKSYPLWELIIGDPLAVRAKIHGWSDAEELERVLLQLIKDPNMADHQNAELVISSDCKLQTVSLSAHEALPKALHVPN